MKSIFASLIVVTLVLGNSPAAERPNIVLIMADDLGLGDVSHHVRTQMGKEPIVETPAIDALARQSLWFTDGHSATSLCSPTRYCVMSGNNNYRSNAPWGVWGTFRETAFVKEQVTLGSVVKDAGYTTGFVGKWHLGGDFRDLKTGGVYRGTGKETRDISGEVDTARFVGAGPRDCGFDYDFTLPCGIQGPIYIAYENEVWHPLSKDSKIVYLDKSNAINAKDVSDKGPGMGDSAWDTSEMGKLISAKAVSFIDDNAGQEAPFFLYYCSPMVHVPHCPPDEFDGKKINGATPSPHLDMVLDLDQQVRRIVEALKNNKVYDNTLIVFVSDNGGLSVKASVASGHETSGGWAGFKNSPLEGGHRTPFFAVWKDHIKPGVTDQPAINQDMLATLAALVGTKVPKGQAQDSNNLLPLLTGVGTFKQRDYLVQQAGSKKELMYRKWPWKLVIQSNHQLTTFDAIALYNLQDDPVEKESNNLVNDPAHKSRVEEMLHDYLEIYRSRQRTVPVTTIASATKKPVKNPLAPRPDTPTWTDAKIAAEEFPGFAFLGEYVKGDQAIQVVSCGERFYLSMYQGGLPGAGWDGEAVKHEWLEADAIKTRLDGYTKIDRSSQLEFPTPPQNAVVLFDGSDKKEWSFGKIKDSLLQAGAKSKREFKDFTLHFECIVPFKPTLPLSHPDRGNSGVFAVGAYEIQVADTFGLDVDPNAWAAETMLKKPNTWCGSIYGIRTPDVNVCLPPLSWQTFDVKFTAARFKDGKKVTNARMTVMKTDSIHDNVELPEGTGGGPSGPRPEVEKGPISIQNHHNPTQYRNIWVIEH